MQFLAKESVEAIPTFFSLNPDITRLFNSQHVKKIEVVLNETEDVKHRIEFFEQTGIIRDVVQNHLTEILADLLSISKTSLRSRSEILLSLIVKRLHAEVYSTYNEEASEFFKTTYASKTSTFVQAELRLAFENWTDVPLFMTAGKKLQRKISMARILFNENDVERELVFHIGGAAEIDFPAVLFRGFDNFNVKCPLSYVRENGFYLIDPTSAAVSFNFCRLGEKFSNAYENILRNVLVGGNNFSADFEFIINSWRLWDPFTKETRI